MKKIVVWLLCAVMLLCVACAEKPDAGNEPEKSEAPVVEQPTEAPTPEPAGEDPTAEPEPTETPDQPATEEPEPTEAPTPEPAADLPKIFDLYEDVGLDVSEAEMFRYDIDFDGKEEVISFRLDTEEDTTTILIDDQEVLFDTSSMLSQVVLIDLDPNTPYVNLLVEIDWGSDDYITTEVHMKDGKPVKGVETNGIRIDEDGRVIVYERCEFLGTRFFGCVAQGESLTAEFEDWYDCVIPTEEEIRDEFDMLVEFGDLLHTTREVPCTINGKNAKLAKNTYIYVLRINPGKQIAEVSTLDGKVAVLAYTIDEDYWPYRINGVPQDDCFDNILHAD